MRKEQQSEHINITQICTKCGIKKPLTEFYKATTGKNGRRGDCKICCSKDKALYYLKNRERLLAASRRYKTENPEKGRITSRQWQTKHPDKWAKINRAVTARYNVRHPDRVQARHKLQGFFRHHKIRLRYCAWPGCPETNKIVGHHDDYAKPYKITPLCQVHHILWHRAIQERKQSPEALYTINLTNLKNNRKEKLCVRH